MPPITDTGKGTILKEAAMNERLIERVRATLARPDAGQGEGLPDLGPSTWARLISSLPPEEVPNLLARLPAPLAIEIVETLDPAAGRDLLTRLAPAEAAALLEAMDPDDATDIVAQLPEAGAERLLGRMSGPAASRVRLLMTYPPDSAGGRMTPSFLAVLPDTWAEKAIAIIREAARQPETIYYIYVVDDARQFLGVLSLRQLLLASADTPVVELIARETVAVRVDTDQEEAARLLTERNLLALPVLDADGRLAGIITEDDVADVLVEEATEDMERLGGSQPLETPYRHATIPLLFRKRIVWLLALFVAEAYTGSVMRLFEAELEQVVALAFFVPLLLGTGGNVGSQITTTLVRAMAVDNLRLRDVRWVLTKETGTGLLIGAVMAAVAYVRAEILGVGADVALVVAITIAVISVWSSIVAAILPMGLRRLGFDPTVVSAPFITTLVDGTGLIIYFTIAKVVLDL